MQPASVHTWVELLDSEDDVSSNNLQSIPIIDDCSVTNHKYLNYDFHSDVPLHSNENRVRNDALKMEETTHNLVAMGL